MDEASELCEDCESESEKCEKIGEYCLAKGDYSGAAAWYRKSEELERGAATAFALQLQRIILGGCAADTEPQRHESVEYCRQLSDAGNPVAQETMAYCYLFGDMAERDEATAYTLAWQAEETGEDAFGLRLAPFVLGNCYVQGKGVEADPKKAFSFYLKAAERGYQPAYYRVGRCYAMGSGTEIDEPKAFRAFYRAAEIGMPEAIAEVARRYENGIGVTVDQARGRKWYRRAAKAGVEDKQSK